MARRKRNFSTEDQDNLRRDTIENEELMSFFLSVLKKTA